MTNDEKLTMLRRMTDETEQEVLSTYLFLAGEIVFSKAYPFGNRPEELPAQYDGIHLEIAAYMLNKRGAEGEVSHSENGVSRTYEDGDIPPTLLRRITPMAGVMV